MNDDTTLEPADDAAERAVLGGCLSSSPTAARVVHRLTPDDFVQPTNATVFQAVVELVAADKPTGPVAVLDQLRRTNNLGRAGGPLNVHTLHESAPVAAEVDYHADIVRTLARQRAVVTAANRLALRAGKVGADIEALIDQAHTSMASLRFGDDGGDSLDTLLDLDEFVSQPLPPTDWIIPNLLAVGDRFVLTGFEGLGKSTLIRQIAVCAAAGLHPFTLTTYDQRTVLVIDAENPKRIMIDRFDELRKAAAKRGTPVPPGRLWIDRRPGGLDLTRREDQRWLARRVETVNPDLLVIGPAYKLYIGGGGQREEDLARTVTSVLDEVRELANCALILEHHSPHAQGVGMHRSVRPIGSSLWLRWPEFGYGIRPATEGQIPKERRLVDVIDWRGPRDERPWPTRLESGVDDGWPWREAYPV